jgi:hypothetical protein
MTHEEITKALSEAGLSWRSAGAAIGRTGTMLSRVSQRDAVSRPVARALAVLIDRPVEEVFPDVPSYHGEDPKASRDRRISDARAKLKKAGLAA